MAGCGIRSQLGRTSQLCKWHHPRFHIEDVYKRQAYIFEYLVTTAVARNGANMTVPCQTLVFLDDTLGNVQKADVRCGVGLLSSGDYPQVAVEECLQAVGGEVPVSYTHLIQSRPSSPSPKPGASGKCRKRTIPSCGGG